MPTLRPSSTCSQQIYLSIYLCIYLFIYLSINIYLPNYLSGTELVRENSVYKRRANTINKNSKSKVFDAERCSANISVWVYVAVKVHTLLKVGDIGDAECWHRACVISYIKYALSIPHYHLHYITLEIWE